MNEATADGILYPQASEKPQVNSLDGLWNFRATNQTKQQQGFNQQWSNRPLKQVIGWCSFNSTTFYLESRGALNRITVAINNTFTDSTLPQGARTVPSECS